MKRSVRFAGIVSAVMLLAGTVTVPSFAYIERGDVEIGGRSSYTLKVGETADIDISPYEEDHLPGCGMDDCPDTCGEKDCIIEGPNGLECVCRGLDYVTYHAAVEVESSDDSVASVKYDDEGSVVITGESAGTAKITINASFREYNDAEKTINVTVEEDSDSNGGNGDSGDSGDSSDSDNNSSGDADNNSGNGGSSSSSGNGSSSAGNSSGGQSGSSGNGSAAGGGQGTSVPSGSVNNEQVKAESYSVRSYNNSRAEDDQNIEIKIKFSAPVKLTGAAENDILVKIAGNTLDKTPNAANGVSTRTLLVKADPSDNSSVIVTIGSVKGSTFIRMTNAKLEISASESGIKNIVSAADGTPVSMGYISTVIPSGLELTQTASVTGTASQAASVTKAVTHRANVRGMVYIQVLRNGQPLLSTDSFDHEGSYVIHAHSFIDTASGDEIIPEMTEADYAKVIAQTFAASIDKTDELKNGYEMTAEGGSVTLKALKPSAGETLDIRIYEWPVAGSVIADSAPGQESGSVTFSDVNGWEKEYVYYLAERNILNGKGDGTFKPADNITRAEFVKILAVVSGDDVSKYSGSSFSDVDASAWYAPYVEWGYRNGIIKGSGGKFMPSAQITRQDMAVMIANFSRYAGKTIPAMETEKTFADSTRISDYAKDSVTTLQKAGIISGDVNGKFLPKSSATRAQAAKMVTVYMQVTA